MDDRTLIALLGGLEPPNLELSRERAITNIPARLPSAETAKKRPEDAFLRSRGLGRLRWGAATLALCLTLASFSLLTPPGQAVTSWVGERLGFGEPGGRPTLRQLRAGWTKGTVAEGQPAHVLVVGPVPGGGRYEFITFWPDEPQGVREDRWDFGGPCFELDLTQQRSSFTGGCGVLPEGPHLAVAGIAGGSTPRGEVRFLAGRTSTSVAAVEAELGGDALDIDLMEIPDELVAELRLGRSFKFFIGFLDGVPARGTLSVTARDATGRALARRRIEVFNFPVPRGR